jgi:hypothetical protein
MNSITLDCKNKNLDEIIPWCFEHYGKDFDYRSEFPSYRWVFTFPTKEDLTLFQLRWQ